LLVASIIFNHIPPPDVVHLDHCHVTVSVPLYVAVNVCPVVAGDGVTVMNPGRSGVVPVGETVTVNASDVTPSRVSLRLFTVPCGALAEPNMVNEPILLLITMVKGDGRVNHVGRFVTDTPVEYVPLAIPDVVI
jgi:hypothetical protein